MISSKLDKMREHRNIVSFRNIPAHGYDSIDNRIVGASLEKTWANSPKM
jgi:uncharacterized protein YutE (UPF0331/DUF86 family)